MPPGYITLCPGAFPLPVSALWVQAAWVAAYVLYAETLALALALVLSRRRRAIPLGWLWLLAPVAVCALAAILVARWINARDAQFCLPRSFSSQFAARMAHEAATFASQAPLALGAIAALTLLGTTFTALVTVRLMRRHARPGGIASA